MSDGAVFSPDRVYRYELHRHWDSGPLVAFIGLNPSTADETVNDPTIRRCIRFARDWGYGGLVMLNLFAYRATDPRQLRTVADPIGPENDRHLIAATADCGLIVAAWGAGGGYLNRAAQVTELLPWALQALGETASGEPRHPLYMPAATIPTTFIPRYAR